MRRCWGQFLLAFCACAPLAASPVPEAAAQAAEETKQPREELTAETLGKLTLTLDVGGHTHEVKKVVFTPDGKHLVSGGGDGSIRIWDVEAGRTVRVLYPPEGRARGLFALSPDGQRLAVLSRSRAGGQNIYLMTFPDGRIERMLPGHGRFLGALAFSADGKRLASSTADSTLRIWDLTEGNSEQEIKTPGVVRALAFSPDGGRLVLYGNDNKCSIKDLTTGKLTPLPVGPPFTNFWPSFDKVAWSPDGKSIAAGFQGGIRVWGPDGKLRLHLLPRLWAHNVAFSADSRRLCATVYMGDEVGGPQSIVFNARTGKEEAHVAMKGFFPWTCALSPDGELAATGIGGDSPRILLWNARTGAAVKTLGAPSWLRGSDVKAAWDSNGTVVQWRTVKDPASWKGGPTSFNLSTLAFGPHRLGKVVTGADRQGPLALRPAGDAAVQVLRNGKPLSLLKLPGKVKEPRVLTLVGPDRAVFSATSYAFFLYDVNTGKLVRTMAHPGWILSLAPSPDGRLLLSLAEDQTLRIWDAREGHLLLTLYVSRSDWVAWTPEGYYAATPGGERLMGWTADNGPNKETDFYPAERFRKLLYRPDVIKLVLEKGSVAEALKVADAARGTRTRDVQVAELLPPRVVLTVVDQSKLPAVKLKVQGQASGKEEPITGLRLLVDGRPLPGGAASEAFESGKQEAAAEWTVTLPPGKHQLAALARCPDSSSFSNKLEVEVADPDKLAYLHVLAVGVSDYEDPSLKLDFAAKDARDVAAGFEKACKGDLFKDVHAEVLADKAARKEAILKALSDMRARVKANDLAVVFFAGHGVKQGDRFYLLNVEVKTDDLPGTAVSGEEMRKALAEFPCQVLLLLDACHSSAGIKNFRPPVDEVTRQMTEDEVGVAVLCSAMAHEKALETGGNGLFTKAVVEGLGRAEGVPYNRSSRLFYVHHLHTYVFDRVSDESGGRQHPFLNLPWVVESFPVARFPAKTP